MDVRVILDQYKAESLTKFHQGHEFERLMRTFFQTDPYYRNLFSDMHPKISQVVGIASSG